MAILSSLFGSSQQQPAVGAQPITTTEIPSELKPYYTDILGKAQALYNKRVEEGYKPYEGPTMAQFTPEQEATFAGIAGLQGQVAPKFAEAEELTRQAAAGITGAQLQEAMSPYQQAVTDIEKRESQKAFEQNVLPKLRAAQVAQGSFGGTRGTLLEAQALADQQRGLADIQTKGSAQAFRDARAALEAERTRMGQGATQLANIAPTALKTGLAELGAQQTVGEEKQRQSQTALDEAYRQFLQEKQEPYEAMQKYQAVVTGAPLTTTQFAPPPPPAPSLGQQLLGGAATAAGLYGAFTGQNPLAAITGKKKGGGIADALPLVKRFVPGSIKSGLPSSEEEKSSLEKAEEKYKTALGSYYNKPTVSEKDIKDRSKQQMYLELAKLGSRLATQSPQQQGIRGILGAGLEVLPESIEEVGKITRQTGKDIQDIREKQSRGQVELAKAEVESEKERTQRERQAREDLFAREKFQKEFDLSNEQFKKKYKMSKEQFAQSMGLDLDKFKETKRQFDLTLEAEQNAAIAKAISDGSVGAPEFKEVGNTVLQMTGADFEQDAAGNVTKYKGRSLRPGVQDEINRVLLKAKSKLASTPGGLQTFYKDTIFLDLIANEIKRIAETPAPQRKEGGKVIKDFEQYAIDRRNKLLNY